jgi:hypothetical protein
VRLGKECSLPNDIYYIVDGRAFETKYPHDRTEHEIGKKHRFLLSLELPLLFEGTV